MNYWVSVIEFVFSLGMDLIYIIGPAWGSFSGPHAGQIADTMTERTGGDRRGLCYFVDGTNQNPRGNFAYFSMKQTLLAEPY